MYQTLSRAALLAGHDPGGETLLALLKCTPTLKKLFQTTCLSLTIPTLTAQPELCNFFQEDEYFQVFIPQHIPVGNRTVGEQFRSLYAWSLERLPADVLVHLAFPDRVAFALLTDHADAFELTVTSLEADDTPLIFHRSEAAWKTHPATYRKLEQMVSTAGEMLLGKWLDFAWAHIAVQAGRLSQALNRTRRDDWSFVAELVLRLEPGVKTLDVDWLAWEDPFILGVDAERLRQERENDPAETRFRMSYVAGMLELLSEESSHI